MSLRARSLAGALLALVALALPALAPTPAVAAETPTTGFYVPRDLPGRPGQLIRSQALDTGSNFAGRASQIMYSSVDTNGSPVAVTGSYFEPTAAWTGPGDRPLVSFASGTIGQGDQCAPSRMLSSTVSASAGSFGINYEAGAINSLLASGVAVVMTDYVGLGTDRMHTYMNRVDQGHAVLDAARAARQVPQATVKAASLVATYGYSQGGGASGAAAELAASYAPDVPLVGSYVGAPPADLAATVFGIDGSAIAGAIGYFANGLGSEYPAVAQELDRVLNDEGKRVFASVSQQCIADTMVAFGNRTSSSWTVSGQPLGELVATDPVLQPLVAAQKLGTVAPRHPVLVATGVHDDIVPHAQAHRLALDWCAAGSTVLYDPIQGPDLWDRTGLNHIDPMNRERDFARDWVIGRFSGRSTLSNCAAVAAMA